ncbi:pyroglutamyl-peptidase I [Bacillus sp. SB49]|uniref:pyroglutamyl-peptidase I n=1 Tax=Bacillaceae TaxID=186817 RepID=UPI0003FEAABD|nr:MULTISPECIES: pyroglutamyl-peptidase I [Bacillaceae]QHT47813.1 pyroglutamyl-peptidase I [Bacillus sp. SB49]
MKKLLLTGFEPFLHFPINPTQQIVEELKGSEMNGYRIEGEILPVDFNRSGKEIKKHIDRVQPDAVISLGLAGGRDKVTPERVAVNWNESSEKDNEGNTSEGEKIYSQGPDGIFSTLPVKEMVQVIKKNGFPSEISNTAGTYLCNHVMYQVLYYFRQQNRSTPSGFIHIPASHELAVRHGNLPSWSLEDLAAAVKAAIEVVTYD